jgi:Arc/MetJ-type ribon-helix-helix transcriptional regulator
MPPIHFTPTPAQQASIEALLQQQDNATPTEFIAEAVEHYIAEQVERQRRLEALRNHINMGVAEAERGELLPLDMDATVERAVERARQGTPTVTDPWITGKEQRLS